MQNQEKSFQHLPRFKAPTLSASNASSILLRIFFLWPCFSQWKAQIILLIYNIRTLISSFLPLHWNLQLFLSSNTSLHQKSIEFRSCILKFYCSTFNKLIRRPLLAWPDKATNTNVRSFNPLEIFCIHPILERVNTQEMIAFYYDTRRKFATGCSSRRNRRSRACSQEVTDPSPLLPPPFPEFPAPVRVQVNPINK